MNPVEHTCPRCGLVFVPGKLEGLCPVCLFGDTVDLVDDGQDTTAFWEDKATSAAEPGRRFSHFEILDELGRGGMGTVYKARDHVTDRIVALKVLQAHHLYEADLVQRFRSEVRAISSLDHRHILPIHEVGEHDGVPFFSMKLAAGGSLAQHLGDYVGHPRCAAELLVKVARGVQHAHERGILHRDLKPGNILLDETAEPFVCDFGLAKWLKDDRRLTLTSVVLGTPHYIAPEQATGKQGLTIAADIYSLGAILYELLTGRPPFVGETAFDTLRQASQNSPAKPSSIVNGTPRDLETICLKALEREPAARYATSGALADDLDHWLAGRPIRARPVGAAEQLWRWARRNPLPAALSATLVIALTVIAIGSTIAAINIDRSRTQAVAAQDRATAAEQDAREKLYQSLLAQARASRKTGQVGHRIETLKTIKEAVAIRPSLELRNEAIAVLGLVDVELTKRFDVRESSSFPLAFDTLLKTAIIAETGQLRVVSLENGSLLKTIPVQGLNWTEARVIAHSGRRYLALHALDGTLSLWDIEAGQLVRRYSDRRFFVHRSARSANCVFSPDETLLAMASPDHIEIVEVASGKEVARLAAAGAGPLVFDPTGTRLAFGIFTNKTVQIWTISQTAPEQTLSFEAEPGCLAWSKTEKLAVGCVDFSIRLVATDDWHRISTLSGHSQPITQVLFNHRGDILASTASDRTIRLWDIPAKTALVKLPAYGEEPTLRFSRDDRRLATTNYRSSAAVFTLVGLERPCLAFAPLFSDEQAFPTASVEYSRDSRLLAAASSGSVRMFDAKKGVVLRTLPTTVPTQTTLRFLPDQKTLLVLPRRQGLTRYEFSYLEETLQLRASQTDGGLFVGYELCSDQDANSALVCLLGLRSARGTCKRIIWNARTGKILPSQDEDNDSFMIRNSTISADQNWCATSYWLPNTTRTDIHSLSTGALVATLPKAGSILGFSPNGRWLATSANSTFSLLWDTATWRRGPALPPKVESEVEFFAFSPDEAFIASASATRVDLVALPSGRLLAAFEQGDGAPRVRISPDGTQLAVQKRNNFLTLWNLRELRRQLRELNLDWED